MLSFAHAKINLGLHITEKRADGYHSVETVMYPVKLYDAVELTDADTTELHIPGLHIPGNPEDNLCMRAFQLLASKFNLSPQRITLLKKIPIGAGLGGGSADAAAVINLVNQKFDLKLSVMQRQDFARSLGADCAFFIEGTPAYATGIGDVLEKVSVDLKAYNLVLVMPPVHVSTQNAYSLVKPTSAKVDLREVIHLPLGQWKEHMLNHFEPSVFQQFPEIERLKEELYKKGAIFASMSGSGASVFGIFEEAVDLQLPDNYRIFYNL